MDVYVYETPAGRIADFRPYLDGKDHAFDPPRALRGSDPRWEKILNTTDPRTGKPLWGNIRFVGTGRLDDYHELVVFPVPYTGEGEGAEDETSESGAGAETDGDGAGAGAAGGSAGEPATSGAAGGA